ncbi:MAG: hypothetical protein HYY84_06630 [Deltaproteobacteria bacterium]|nr:hypothetical protein [Deltaproteobacteria bacterium]
MKKSLVGLMTFMVGCSQLFSGSGGSGARAGSRGGDDGKYGALFLNFQRTEFCGTTRTERGQRIYSPRSTDLSTKVSPGENILRLMCTEGARGAYNVTDQFVSTVNDAAPDPLTVGILVVACVGTGECESATGRPHYGSSGSNGRRYRFAISISADVADVARRVPQEAVKSAVEALDLPGDIKSGFTTRFDACRAHLVAEVEALNPRLKKVYVETITKTRAERFADEQALASFYQRYAAQKPKLDRALLSSGVTAALRNEARSLRDAYVDACLKRGRTALYCLTGPVARPLTDLLVRLAIALRDPVGAEAENATLAIGPDQTSVKTEMHLAVGKAMRAETTEYRKYMDAKRQGTDPSVLASTFGNPPPVNLGEYRNGAGAPPPQRRDYWSEINRVTKGGLERIRRTIARVSVSGNSATIAFKDIVNKSDVQTGCRETNKIQSITRHGEIVYRVDCSGPWVTRTSVNRVKPIVVAAREARRLKSGNVVMAVADKKSRRGAVLTAFRSERGDDANDPIQYGAFPAKARR